MRRWVLAGLVGLMVATGVFVGLAWSATADVRALWANLDALLNPVTVVRPDSAVLVRSVRDLARLETARATLEQRVVGQRGSETSWIWLGERMELVARGEAVAGVDLGELVDGDIRVDEDGSVIVKLPPATIWDVHLDEQATFVAARERGWLGWNDPQLESQVRRAAVDSLRAEAVRIRLTERADTNARVVIGDLLRASGATNVRFE